MEFGSIKLIKGMNREEVNKLTSDWIVFDEDEYKGSKHYAKWICPKCGEGFNCRFSDLKLRKKLQCGDCTYRDRSVDAENKYKDYVNLEDGYEYICTYHKGDKLPNGKKSQSISMMIKHVPCSHEYVIKFDDFKNGSRCIKCCKDYEKSIEYNNPNLAKMIHCDEDKFYIQPRYIHANSNRKFYIKCKDCGKISKCPKSINKINKNGYSCEYCSDGMSTPEKFMRNILIQLNENFKSEANKKELKWIKGNERYDFLIYNEHNETKDIIEVHGGQHYRDGFNKTFEEQIKIDEYKKELALSNGIQHYIEIDCRHSDFMWLKTNVYKSLSEYYNLENIDWECAWKESQSSLVKQVWDLWNSGKFNSPREISQHVKVNISTIHRYLKKGNESSVLNYDKEFNNKKKMVIEYSNGDLKEFESVNDLIKFLGVTSAFYKKNIIKNKKITIDNIEKWNKAELLHLLNSRIIEGSDYYGV